MPDGLLSMSIDVTWIAAYIPYAQAFNNSSVVCSSRQIIKHGRGSHMYSKCLPTVFYARMLHEVCLTRFC